MVQKYKLFFKQTTFLRKSLKNYVFLSTPSNRHCGLDPQSPNFQQIASQARNDRKQLI